MEIIIIIGTVPICSGRVTNEASPFLMIIMNNITLRRGLF